MLAGLTVAKRTAEVIMRPVARVLDPATRDALTERMRFYRDLGLTDFYRRPVDPKSIADKHEHGVPQVSILRPGTNSLAKRRRKPQPPAQLFWGGTRHQDPQRLFRASRNRRRRSPGGTRRRARTDSRRNRRLHPLRAALGPQQARLCRWLAHGAPHVCGRGAGSR